jgi:hypothetical protein
LLLSDLAVVEEVAMSGSITGAKRRREPEPPRTAARPPPQDPIFHGNLDALAAVLSQRTDLQHIHAVHGNLSPELAAEIAGVLADSSALQYLKIESCRADGASLIAVADAVAGTASLHTFAIKHTGAVRGWASALTRALRANTSMSELHIGGTIVYANEAAALAQAVGRHPTLGCVVLGAMRSPAVQSFLKGLADLGSGALEKLVLQSLAMEPQASCIDALCAVTRGGQVKCIEVDTALKSESIDQLLVELERDACTTTLDVGERLVLGAAQQARRHQVQQAAMLRHVESTPQPFIEMQA